MRVCVPRHYLDISTCIGQSALFLEQQLQVVTSCLMWVIRIKPKFFVTRIFPLNCWVISLDPHRNIINNFIWGEPDQIYKRKFLVTLWWQISLGWNDVHLPNWGNFYII